MGHVVQAKGGAVAVKVDEAPSQYLTFALGGEMFAVGILNVKEIIEYGHLTEIPMMPAFIRGVINLRGSVVPVIDLSARFGGKTTEVSRRTCIVIVAVKDGKERHDIADRVVFIDGGVIVEGSEGEIRHDNGIMVEAVSEVLDIPGSEIEPPPSFGAKIRADFIFGMGKVGGKFVIILNIDKVLSVVEFALLTGSDGIANELLVNA